MGAAQSYMSSEAVVATAVVAAGAVVFRMNKANVEATTPQQQVSEKRGDGPSSSGPKKGKKKSNASLKRSSGDSSSRLTLPATLSHSAATIPGGFESASAVSNLSDVESTTKPKKAKKKKGKALAASSGPSGGAPVDVHSESSSAENPSASNKVKRPAGASGLKSPALSSMSIETDGSWTRVDSRRMANRSGAEISTSDAGITGNSSPTTEKTEDETPFIMSSKQKPFAEKMLPKPRRTGVSDMVEESDFPGVSRVMRVAPNADEKPAKGFTWGDYEDVNESATSAAGGTDADRDDDGWGVVKRGKSTTERISLQPSQRPPTTESKELTKKQRQNAKKREVAKAIKAETEADRQAGLAKHKREQEKARIAEQMETKSKGGKSTSGGMVAAVDANGRLVWE